MVKKKIFVAGHKGMVGSAIVRILEKQKEADIIVKDRKELDLINQESVLRFFKRLFTRSYQLNKSETV